MYRLTGIVVHHRGLVYSPPGRRKLEKLGPFEEREKSALFDIG